MKLLFLVLTMLVYSYSTPAFSQVITTQERFQDLFTTAGYGTAFGAAMGAAILPFQDNPEKNLRLVAVGASLGFIGGSLLGSYVIFSPGFSSTEPIQLGYKQKLALGPILDDKGFNILGFQGTFKILEF